MSNQMMQRPPGLPPGLPLPPSHSHQDPISTASMLQNGSGDNGRPAMQAQFLASMQRPPGLPAPPNFTFRQLPALLVPLSLDLMVLQLCRWGSEVLGNSCRSVDQ